MSNPKRIHSRELTAFFHWVKAVLIEEYALKGNDNVVLDLFCGENKDIKKWTPKAQFYVGIDPSVVALGKSHRQLRRLTRASSSHGGGGGGGDSSSRGNCKHTLIKANPATETVVGKLAEVGCNYKFSVVTCFFHWGECAASEENLRRLVQNVASSMAPSAVFLGIVMDANILVKRLRTSDSMAFGNALYTIEFPSDKPNKCFPKSQPCGHPFCVHIHPPAAADTHATPATPTPTTTTTTTEFLVIWPFLEKVASECGLTLRWQGSLHDVYHVHHRAHAHAWRQYHILSLADEDWELAHLYKAFVFGR